MSIEKIYEEVLALLKQLIATSSFSKEEGGTATIIQSFLVERNIAAERSLNNVWAVNKYFDAARPTILLNSHHDTVKPNPQYINDPFEPIEKDGKLFGLGSNDAGGCLVSLIAAFLYFYNKEDLNYNILIAATAEEEISGVNGIEKLIVSADSNSPFRGLWAAIVGEPTLTNLAIAEKGLLVLDCKATGKAGHAAREEGKNAIYKAIEDINWFSTYQFPKISATLGAVKMSVTSIHTENKAHNVIPAVCDFVVDIRVTDRYTHEELLAIIQQHVSCQVKPRSMRMRSSSIAVDHSLVQAGLQLGKKMYGSPTTSDAALIPGPVLKCGPGDSARSHSADEFIYTAEIREGIKTYIDLLEQVILNKI